MNKKIKASFRTFSPNYLNASYYNYYVPYSYLEGFNYEQLPNGISNGFNTIYAGN